LPTNRRHYRIKLGDALSAHESALQFGGLGGIHNLSLIESAIARPYCGYYRAISQKAAALVQSLASNHGFIDGNKRTTLILLNLLLLKSRYGLRARSEAQLNRDVEDMILNVVQHQLTFDDLVDWFRQRIEQRSC
jgi:death on curing protein